MGIDGQSIPGIAGPLGISFCCSGSSAGLNSGALGVYKGRSSSL